MIFSYSRAIKMNKSPAFILNVLGWQPDNIDAQLKKIDEHTVQLRWTADVSPAVALNILSTPIASIVDSKAALANVKDGDFGNAWLKMHSAGSGRSRCASISRTRRSCWTPTPPRRATSRS